MARPRSDIAPRILHAARERFLQDGVDGASLRRIAREAKTSIAMIYYYFPAKDDLFLAVVEEAYGQLLADLEVALADDVPVVERIHRLYERVGRMSEDEAMVMRIVVREILVSSERRRRIVERFSRGHLPLVLRTIADGLATGTLRTDLPPPVLVISTLALAFVPQLVRRLIGDNLPFGIVIPRGEELSRYLADVLVDGVSRRKLD